MTRMSLGKEFSRGELLPLHQMMVCIAFDWGSEVPVGKDELLSDGRIVSVATIGFARVGQWPVGHGD
jgi:hypothetical protein